MAHLTPEEVIEKFGPIHNLQPSPLCSFLCREFQDAADAESENPSPANQKRLLAISHQVVANHCKCYLQ